MMRNVQKKTKISAIVTYGIIVGILAFFMLWNAEWTLGDQAHLMNRMPFGGHMSLKSGISADAGRFMPLISYDYNILWILRISSPPCWAFFVVNVIGFLCTAVFLFLLLHHISKKINPNGSWWVATVGSLVYLFGTYKVQLELIYSERIMGLMIVAFIYFGLLFWEKGKWYFALISIFSAGYAAFCKEPFFGTLLVFAGFLLIFWKGLDPKKKIYLWSIIAVSISHIILYLTIVYPYIETAFDPTRGETDKLAIVLQGLWSQKILFLAIPILLFRVYHFMFKKDRAHLFFDAILLAGLSYTLACVVLSLNDDYYYYTATIFLIIAVVYFLFYYIKTLWTTIVLIPFLLFYAYQVPPQIVVNQQLRKTTYNEINVLAEAYMNGQKLYFEPCDDTPDSWDMTVCSWRCSILRLYIAVIVKDHSFQFEKGKPNHNYINIRHCPENEISELALSPYCIDYIE